jgi:LysM repeat protein
MGLSTTRPVAAQTECGDTYIVRAGDTLRDIADQCGVTMQAVLEANPSIENPNLIFVGEVIDLPQPGETPPPPDQFVYIVRPGDWLRRIARRFDVNVAALLRANPQLETPNVIYPGQRLIIPLQPGQPTGSIAPPSGPAGTQVRVEGSGFRAEAPVEVLLGPSVQDATFVNTVQTTDTGTLSTRVAIPSDADAGERWVVVLRDPGTGTRAISNEFRVTGGDLFSRANIYLIALDDAGQSGLAVGCGDSVVPVEIEIEPTIAPMTAALEQLLAIDEEFYGQSGLYNALAASDLSVQGIDIDASTAIIALTGELRLGGVCDNPRVKAQLRQTALQFTTVDSVAITVNGTPLDQLLSGQGQ